MKHSGENSGARVAKIAVLLIAILAVGAGLLWHHYHAVPTVHLAQWPAAHNGGSSPPPHPQPKAAGPSDAQLALAFVAKGSGKSVEWALIRQLVADPGSWGFSGDRNDKEAVKQWAGHRAAVLAIKGGYVDWKFGGEVRTYGGVSYVLQKDAKDKTQIVEYEEASSQLEFAANTGSGTFSPATTHTIAASVATSQFFGASPVTGNRLLVPHYEYVVFPGE